MRLAGGSTVDSRGQLPAAHLLCPSLLRGPCAALALLTLALGQLLSGRARKGAVQETDGSAVLCLCQVEAAVEGQTIPTTKEALLNPVVISRNDQERTLIEPSINSCRIRFVPRPAYHGRRALCLPQWRLATA